MKVTIKYKSNYLLTILWPLCPLLSKFMVTASSLHHCYSREKDIHQFIGQLNLFARFTPCPMQKHVQQWVYRPMQLKSIDHSQSFLCLVKHCNETRSTTVTLSVRKCHLLLCVYTYRSY